MLHVLWIGLIVSSAPGAGLAAGQERPKAPLSVVAVDALERAFPDRDPATDQSTEPRAVPLGGCVPFQFVVSSSQAGTAKLRVEALRTKGGDALDGAVTIYEVLKVTVEANSGQSGAQVGKPTEERYRPFQVREAPFEVAEVLAEAETIRLQPGTRYAVVCDVQVARTARVGRYDGALVVEWDHQTIETPLELEVYPTVVPKGLRVASSHWFSELPEELTGGQAPRPWSEEHWTLIERIANQLHAFGDTAVHTVLISAPDPLIRTIRKAEGRYEFDFARFDRWVKTFLGAGYTIIDGASIAGGHWISPPNVYAVEDTSGAGVTLFRRGQGLEELAQFRKKYEWPKYRDEFAKSTAYRQSVKTYGQFLEQFFDELYAHLQENGWVAAYRQGLIDEPRTVEDYAFLSDLCRQHMPGVKIADAIHGYGVEDYEAFSPHVDTWIMEMAILCQPKSQRIIAERRKKGLQTGIYVLGKATPWPNRLLDRPLIENRAQPWLMYLYQADYYIHWAANRYRGVRNPYEHSIGPTGPLPAGRTFTERGHSPGNNWLFYPGPDGLRPSMRVLAFREGSLDYALLSMLAEKDKSAADAIARTIARSATDYETDPASYHRARRALLEALKD